MPELHQKPKQEQRQSAIITRHGHPPLRSNMPSNGPSPSFAAGPLIDNGVVFHAVMTTPSVDDMEPTQNVSFIETQTGNDGVDEADLQLPRELRNLDINSDNRIHRIPHNAAQSSPPCPALLKTCWAGQSPRTSPASPSPTVGYLPTAVNFESDDEGVKRAKLHYNMGRRLKR